MKIILYAIPGFIFLILVEWLYGLARGRNTYRVADTITSILLGSISRLRGLLFLGFGAWFYDLAADGHHLFNLPDEGVEIWLFAIVAYDFSYYWFHRINHEINPFWANVHVYWSVILDSWHARRWRDKLRIWFKRPGWQPAELETRHPVERTSLRDFRKYDPEVPVPARIYAFFQFLCTTLASTGMLVVANNWPSAPLFYAIALIIISFYAQSTWTEGRRFAAWLEWLKLGLIFAAPAILPVGPAITLTLQAYLLISSVMLIWVTALHAQTAAS